MNRLYLSKRRDRFLLVQVLMIVALFSMILLFMSLKPIA
jgi:hypothetical protein